MINPVTTSQLADLDLHADQPLIVCDVDEVIVHFLRGLEGFLAENGLWLDPASFALNGNIKYEDSHKPLPGSEVGGILEQFFSEKTGHLELIDGADEALDAISNHAQVIMLTNMPDAYRLDRIKNLGGHGIHFPVVSNSGPKGPTVKHLAETVATPIVFIDDTPSNVNSVAEHAPDVHILHFMQDHRFRRHLPDLNGIIASVDNWEDGQRYIHQAIEVSG
ncbi:MAG: hypothetical protein GY948_03810 [Alphaproteobacteria bacterium]|nr:hypothetical protein [Alphaproteobacteria bacterium]